VSAEVWECTNAEYHAAMDRIGSSMLQVILASPAQYYRKYIGKDADGQPLEPHQQTEALLLGSLLHCLVLEPEKYAVLYAVEPPGIDRRTNAGKDKSARFAMESIGKECVPHDLDQQARGMAAAIAADEDVQELMAGGIRERAIIWDEDGITCKCKADVYVPDFTPELGLLLDVKSDKNPGPDNFLSRSPGNSIRKYRYDMRLYHYSRGLLALTGKPCSVGLIAVGKDDPYDVFVHNITPWMAVGEMHWHEAMHRLRKGRSDGVWRHPCQGVVAIADPAPWDFEPPVGYHQEEELP